MANSYNDYGREIIISHDYGWNAATGLWLPKQVDANGAQQITGNITVAPAAGPEGTTVDTPYVGVESATARTGISLWKGIKNTLYDALGTAADAIVAAGAVGSISAKLRRVTQGLDDLKTLIVLGAGTAIIGKVGIDQATPGTTNGVQIVAVSACKLIKGGATAEKVTLTNATTDYAAGTAPPAGAKYLTVCCDKLCYVAMGEATSSTKGVAVGADTPVTFPILLSGTAADNLPHAQSPTAGAVVTFTWGGNLD